MSLIITLAFVLINPCHRIYMLGSVCTYCDVLLLHSANYGNSPVGKTNVICCSIGFFWWQQKVSPRSQSVRVLQEQTLSMCLPLVVVHMHGQCSSSMTLKHISISTVTVKVNYGNDSCIRSHRDRCIRCCVMNTRCSVLPSLAPVSGQFISGMPLLSFRPTMCERVWWHWLGWHPGVAINLDAKVRLCEAHMAI